MSGAELEIEIDREVCIGSGMCVMYAGDTFDQDEEAKAIVRTTVEDDEATIRAAAEACPTGAIRVRRPN